MRIAIDARMVRHNSMHGIARYVIELLNSLKVIAKEHEFFILANQHSPLFDNPDWPSHMHLVKVKAPWISFWEQWELPRIIKRLSIDLFHSPSFVAPIFCPAKLVMTIHDLNHLVLPQFYTPFHQIYYQFFVKSCMRKSEMILTVSQFSKNEIIQNLQVEPTKIRVTYNGVSKQYTPVKSQEDLDYVRELYELPDEFIFCLSNNKPHKNIAKLVKSYCQSSIELPLVLACPVDKNLILLSERYQKKHQLYFSRYIEEAHLPTVYSMARLFVYPSTYEGFGLPPLEALSCGASVVVAQSSSLPEIVGKHAIYANPYDCDDLERALSTGIERSTASESRSKKGIEHAQTYSWKRMAYLTLDTYTSAVQDRRIPKPHHITGDVESDQQALRQTS